jgi:hypothetical protein
MSKRQCPQCEREAWYGIEPACRACGFPETAHAPNVQVAAQHSDALDVRFAAAQEKAHDAGRLRAFERLCEVAGTTHAVVNLSLGAAYSLFVREDALYAPYQRQVAAGVRAPAALENDRRRLRVEDALYGTYAGDMVYAALSADGRGLTSYGLVQLELLDVAVAHRATVLEQNSFDLERRFGTELPVGYLGAWADRGKLAGAKLVDALGGGAGLPDDRALGAMLLRSEGDRGSDDFLEVHVYKPFNRDAVRRVVMPRAFRLEEDNLLARVVRAKLPPDVGLAVEDIE